MGLSDLQFLLPEPLRAVLKPAYHKVFPPRPVFIGYVAERTSRHIRGWAENVRDRAQRVPVEIYCTSPAGRRLLGTTIAGLRDPALAAQGARDPDRGFRFTFPEPLSAAERETLEVWPLTALRPLETLSPRVHGYTRRLNAGMVMGWLQDATQPERRLAVEAVVRRGGMERVVGGGVADRRDQRLAANGHAFPECGFRITFDPPLPPEDLAVLRVRAADDGSEITVVPAPPGFVRERTGSVVAGWAQDPDHPGQRLDLDVFLCRDGGERLIASGRADRLDRVLADAGHEDPACGFRIRLDPPLGDADLAGLVVRTRGDGATLDYVPAPPVGYVRERTARHVAGWLLGPGEAPPRLAVEAVLVRDGREQHLAEGIADHPDVLLAGAGMSDSRCGFRLNFDPLPSGTDPGEIIVRARDSGTVLEDSASAMIGYLRARTIRHVDGWVRNPAEPGERVAIEAVVVRPGAERVIATATADRYDRVLAALGIGDALHGFRIVFPEPITPEDLPALVVRSRMTGYVLEDAPGIQTEWRPLRYVAMDIVDNCNLRCPFCLFDHAPVHRTNVMAEETFEAAIRLLPFVGPEGHWMSCLHEPSMHPNLTGFLRKIPRENAHLMTYTTNLAKRMPDAYFEALADSGLSNINVSIESRDPAIYERMRKGARHRIFMENWDKLLAAFAKGKAPPPLRYISMAYKSNYREIPALIEYLRTERNAWKVEVRDTYDVAHIDPAFREAEYLEREQWMWLRDALSRYSPHEVVLTLPPGFDDAPVAATAPAGADAPAIEAPAPPPPTPAVLTLEQQAEAAPGLIEARIFHDGRMFIYTSPDGNYPNTGIQLAEVNIRDITDPAAFLMEMVARTVE